MNKLTTSTPPPQKPIEPPTLLPSCQSEREEDRVFEFAEERARRRECRKKDNENYEIMREEREESNRLKNNFCLYHCATFRMVL